MNPAILRRRRGGSNPFNLYANTGSRARTVADYSRGVYGKPNGDNATPTTYTDLHVDGGEMSGLITAHDADGMLKHNAHNLLTYSEDASNLSPLNLTVVSNIATAPDGTATADLIYPTSSGPSRRLLVLFSTGNLTYDTAVWVKAAGKTVVLFPGAESASADDDCYFDLSAGTVASSGPSVISPTITDEGNGWFKIKVGSAVTTSTAYFNLIICDAAGVNYVNTSGTDGIYVWGAHAYRSDLPMQAVPTEFITDNLTTYVPTTSTARYLPFLRPHTYNGSEWIKRGIAVAPAATNLLTYSENLADASWLTDQVTVTSNATTAPDGSTNADQVIETTANNQHIIYTSASVTSGTSYAGSFFIKKGALAGASDWVQIAWRSAGHSTSYCNFNIANGTVGNNTATTLNEIESCGGGWYRVSSVATADGTSASGGAYIAMLDNADTASRAPAYVGTTDSDIFVWGAQLETGSVPTPYIPTYGAAVSRAAFNPEIKAAYNGYDAGGMSLAMDGVMTYADNNIGITVDGETSEVPLMSWVSDGSNYIFNAVSTGGAAVGQSSFLQEASGTFDIVSSVNDYYSPGVNVPFSIASRHTDSDINGAVDGTALTADATVSALADLSAVNIELGPTFNGAINKFLVYPPLDDDALETASEVS